MIIQNHDTMMHSQQSNIRRDEISQQIMVRLGRDSGTEQTPLTEGVVNLDLSLEAMTRFKESTTVSRISEDDSGLPSKLQMAKTLLEKFFGIKVKIYNPQDHSSQTGNAAAAGETQAASSGGQGWGIRIDYHESHYSKDSVDFSAEGEVSTQDGRKLNFALQLNLSRESLTEINMTLQAGDPALTDPLVLNFDGKSVRLSTEKFAFDLNMDGVTEDIAQLEEGSGYLVLDKNKNGTIDDGSEMFGPTTNNGFLELREYDDDGNQWIDENDAVFYQLGIWTPNSEGSSQPTDLKTAGVGALYLNTADTQWELQGGRLRESGLFLMETGEANLLQEVDLEV